MFARHESIVGMMNDILFPISIIRVSNLNLIEVSSSILGFNSSPEKDAELSLY